MNSNGWQQDKRGGSIGEKSPGSYSNGDTKDAGISEKQFRVQQLRYSLSVNCKVRPR